MVLIALIKPLLCAVGVPRYGTVCVTLTPYIIVQFSMSSILLLCLQGIMLVYDVIQERSFDSITKRWLSFVIPVSHNIKACLHYESS